jgi:hypothetical protein
MGVLSDFASLKMTFRVFNWRAWMSKNAAHFGGSREPLLHFATPLL